MCWLQPKWFIGKRFLCVCWLVLIFITTKNPEFEHFLFGLKSRSLGFWPWVLPPSFTGRCSDSKPHVTAQIRLSAQGVKSLPSFPLKIKEDVDGGYSCLLVGHVSHAHFKIKYRKWRWSCYYWLKDSAGLGTSPLKNMVPCTRRSLCQPRRSRCEDEGWLATWEPVRTDGWRVRTKSNDKDI